MHSEACRSQRKEARADDDRVITSKGRIRILGQTGRRAGLFKNARGLRTTPRKRTRMKGGSDISGGVIASASGGMSLQVQQPELLEARTEEDGGKAA